MSSLACLLAVLSQAPAAEALTLERAMELALSRNERAKIAGAQNDAADGRLVQARAFFFPTITLTGQYTRRAYEVVREVNGEQVVLQQFNALNANANLRWILFDARSIPLYRAALADQRATRLEAAEAKRRLGFEASEAFLQTLGLELVAEAARRRVELASKNVADARARKDAGLSSSNDVTRNELEEANARLAWLSARAAAETARRYLGWFLDLQPSELGPLTPPQPLYQTAQAQPVALPQDEVARAAEARPDVRALTERTAQQTELSRAPLLGLVPVLGLTAQGRVTNEGGFVGLLIDGFIGLDLSWALFDGGNRYGARDERDAFARIAALNERLQTRGVALEVDNALVMLTAARETDAQSQVAVNAATRNAQETGELYRQGLTTAFQLADATLRQFEADVAQVRARYAVLMALLDLRAALGVDPLGREVQP